MYALNTLPSVSFTSLLKLQIDNQYLFGYLEAKNLLKK